MASIPRSDPHSPHWSESYWSDPFTLANSLRVPAASQAEADQTLAGIAGGSLLGTGQSFRTDIEGIRNEYKRQIAVLDQEITAKRAAGVADAEIRPWAVAERTRIARSMRWRQGPVASVALEARDWMPPVEGRFRNLGGYGWGGRSAANLEARALSGSKFPESGLSLDAYLIRGAVSPNTGISEAALRAGKYLKSGGKVLVPLGAAVSAYEVYEAPAGEKLQTAGVEASSAAGGYVASELAVALMIAAAPETGGLSLLGIAFVAGTGGAMFSGWGAHKLFFSKHQSAGAYVKQGTPVPGHLVQPTMP